VLKPDGKKRIIKQQPEDKAEIERLREEVKALKDQLIALDVQPCTDED